MHGRAVDEAKTSVNQIYALWLTGVGRHRVT